MPIADVWEFVQSYGLIILAVAGLVVGLVFLVGFMGLLFDALRKRESRFLSEATVNMIEGLLKMGIAIGMAVYFAFLLQLLSPWIHTKIWAPLLDFLPSIVLIAAIIALASVSARMTDTFVSYLKGDLRRKPPKVFKGEYVGLMGLLVKYIMFAAAFLSIILIVLISLGFASALGEWMAGFLARNVMFFAFIVIVVFIAYFLNRFSMHFFSDLEAKSSRVSPQLARSGGTVARIGIYALAGLLVVFSILNMANLGGISQTILLLATTLIGIIVAMAGTGSIGNALSGAVLLVFRPIKAGDRVELLSPALVCDVVDVTLIFTRVRTLENELVEIPNNLVLAAQVKNLTESKPYAISVKAGIGYDVHHSTVEKLMIEAAKRTKDVLDTPAPRVFMIELGDYAITHELWAYTMNEKEAKFIRSELMRNMQDAFYDNGVEIMSPMYIVRRDGAKVEKTYPPRPAKVDPKQTERDNNPGNQ